MAYWKGNGDIKKKAMRGMPHEARVAVRNKSIATSWHYFVRNSVYLISCLMMLRACEPFMYGVSLSDYLIKPMFVGEITLLTLSILLPLMYHNLKRDLE